MRRNERAQEFAQRNLGNGLGSAAPAAPRNGRVDDADNGGQDTDQNVKVGAEAFVARGNGSDYWDTDETLEAYIAKR